MSIGDAEDLSGFRRPLIVDVVYMDINSSASNDHRFFNHIRIDGKANGYARSCSDRGRLNSVLLRVHP